MPSNSSIDERLASFFARSDARNIVAAYLFGSHAAGRAHRESDIDVALLFDWDRYPDESGRFAARVHLIGELGSALESNRVDLVVLNDAPAGLAHAIVTRGRRVFCRNTELDHAFVRDTMLRAADLQPWLQGMRRITLDALRR